MATAPMQQPFTHDSELAASQSQPQDPRPISKQVPPLSASSERQPLSETEEAKVLQIANATESRDYHALTELAASPGGFIDDEVRRIVCTSWEASFVHTFAKVAP